MPFGNCLVGLIFIMMFAPEKGRIVIKRRGFFPSHFMFRGKSGTIYHYRAVRECLPYPFEDVLYLGEFHSFPDRLPKR
jgi:hypothetical protein